MSFAQKFFRSLLRIFLFSVWVPLSVVALYMIRFGILATGLDQSPVHLPTDVGSYLGLLVAWVCGMSITLAFKKLFGVKPKTGIFMVIIFAPLTAFAATVGGLLGAPGVAVYTLVVSLPVWMIFFILKLIQTRKLFQSAR